MKLHIKNGNESQFLYETSTDAETSMILSDIVAIYNGRLKIGRIAGELEELAKHGIFLPPNMQGLTEEQIQELKLKDEWGEKCIPSGGYIENKDPMGRRNGKAPNEKMAEVLNKTASEAKAKISRFWFQKLVQSDMTLNQIIIKDALDMLRGATMIVYPMGLPPYEPIRLELENQEDLSGTQASNEVIEENLAQLWWAGKEIQRGKKLKDYVGINEKTKIVAKLQKKGQGPPSREPVLTDDEKKHLMMQAYRRQEELKKLEEADDDSYLNSEWANNNSLKRSFQGLRNIKWKP